MKTEDPNAGIRSKPKDESQPCLFEKGEWWDEHWKGMPEYVSRDLTPFQTIYVHFAKREDMQVFSDLVKQPLTQSTKMIWYPEADLGVTVNKRYVDELSAETDDVEYSDE